jgi:hypothetical protein
MTSFPRDPEKFERFLVEEYFKYGSVDEVLKRYRFSLPVSYATYQRVLDRYGVIKKASSAARLSEAIDFFEHLVTDNFDLEDLYKKMPYSFQTSIKTLYRIYSYMKEGLTRRVGIALVITPYDNPKKILLARDVSTPSLRLGKKYGSFSLPMGYTRKRDSRKSGIIRILQNEVFTKRVIDGNFPYFVIPDNPEPFMYLDIADVRVACYNLILPKDISSISAFSSYKLQSFNFFEIDKILELNNLRMGVSDIVLNYKKYLDCLERNLSVNPIQSTSVLNKEILEFSLEIDR